MIYVSNWDNFFLFYIFFIPLFNVTFQFSRAFECPRVCWNGYALVFDNINILSPFHNSIFIHSLFRWSVINGVKCAKVHWHAVFLLCYYIFSMFNRCTILDAVTIIYDRLAFIFKLDFFFLFFQFLSIISILLHHTTDSTRHSLKIFSFALFFILRLLSKRRDYRRFVELDGKTINWYQLTVN